MKFSKFSPLSLTAIILLLLVFTSCKDEGDERTIGIDQKNVQEHLIPIDEAIQYTRKFRNTRSVLNRTIAKDSFFVKNPLILLNAEYFNRDAIAALLNQAGPRGGIRIYLGQDKAGKIKLVMVPATRERDIITELLAKSIDSLPATPPSEVAPIVGSAIERGQECPEVCPFSSPLLQ